MASFWSWHLSRYLNEYCLGRFRRRANAKALRQECTWSVCWGPIRWPVGLPGWLSGKESAWDTTEQLHFHFSLSCVGEGNGNPLQCSCLENPRDGGAWRAAVYGVAQSRTRLKRLSSSSSSSNMLSSRKKMNTRYYSNSEKAMATHSSILAWKMP